MHHLPRLAFLLLLVVRSFGAPPTIDNRPAQADEWGYRPADGSTAVMNPPSFTWIHDKRATTYEVQWSRTADFAGSSNAVHVPWCVYTSDKTLVPGKWFWRYRFTTEKGEVSDWSVLRSVVVPENAIPFPMPTRAQQAERLPKAHPRLFLRPEDLPRLRAAATAPGPAADLFKAIRKQADKLIESGPTPEPKVRGSARDKKDTEAVEAWWPNRETCDRAGEEAETLAFAWMITREAKYGEAARKFIMALAAWDPDGPTNFALNCEAGKSMLYHPTRAYDWAFDVLTEEERARFRQVWIRRVGDAWKSGEVGQGNGHLTKPYNSHGNRVWHKIAEVGIAFHGDVPEAATWLDYAVNKFYAAYPVWSDDDGGWHEGASYLTGYMTKATSWLQVARSALDIDGLKKPFFAQVGNLPLYVVPPNTPASGFGDLSFKPVGCGFLHYFARVKAADAVGAEQAAYWSWWLQTTKTKAPSGWAGFLYATNLPALPAPKAPDALPSSRIFQGTGVASLHDTLLDSREDVHFLLKADPFGTQSHGHSAQLGCQLTAYGDCLLPAVTYRDLHGSDFHYQWCHSTRSQNSVLIDGEGQRPHSVLSTGRILDSRLTKTWDYVRAEATEAYAGKATRAERSVVFVKPDLIVLYDDFATPQPSNFQFMLHGLSAFTLDEAAQTLRLDQPHAGLLVKYLAPQPLAFTQTDGYNPPPKMRNKASPFPNQWHVEASTRAKSATSDTITFLMPYRAGAVPDFKAERLDTGTASGARITLGGRQIGVAFRKHEAQDATWGGEKLDGPVKVVVP